VDPASMKADALGEIPVFMIHQLKENPTGGYDQTPEHFKAVLQQLYDMKFRPITAANLIASKVDVAPGMHPMVLTFDDGTVSQAGIGPDGNPRPDTALGILEAFGKAHPDFHPTATFYVNASPFQDPKVLPWLVAHGYDVGVHTMTHANLKQLGDAAVQKEIGGNYTQIEQALPGFKITSMALPFGVAPVHRVLAYKGTYNGTNYDMAGVMLVGSDPSVSPFSTKFDPLYIHRIRFGPGGVTDDADYWLTWFKAHPAALYTSDGNPDKVSFPASESSKLAPAFAPRANPYGDATSSTSDTTPGAHATATPKPKLTASPKPKGTASPSSGSTSTGSTSSGSTSSGSTVGDNR
jgi:peptidoglycan/xylan/chitin deacetylase (PgdA/CDA1 family)